MAIEESALYKRWVGFLFGIRVVIDQLGNKLPERAKLKIVGASAYDDPSTSSTVLDFSTISPSQHGNLAGGALHALATTSANGFMSAADKVIVNNIAATYMTGISVTAPLAKTGPALSPTISIAPANGRDPGSMSAAHYVKLSSIPAWNVDDAANSLVQRNPDGGIHVKHVRVWSSGPLGTSVPMPDGAIAPRYQLDADVNFSRAIPLNWSACKVSGVVSWSISDVSNIVNDVTDAFANMSIELEFPHGSKIRSIDIRSRGPGSGSDPLPANAPSFTLYRKNISTGIATVIGTLNDTLDGSYRGNAQTHTIDLTGSPHSVDASAYRYYLVITPEFGTDAIVGYLVVGCVANMTYPQQYDIVSR